MNDFKAIARLLLAVRTCEETNNAMVFRPEVLGISAGQRDDLIRDLMKSGCLCGVTCAGGNDTYDANIR